MALISPDIIVARTQNCDFPKWIESKTIINNYPELDIEGIVRLKPDLIISQKGITSQSQIEQLERFNIPVFICNNNTLDKVINICSTIGQLTGDKERGEFVQDSLQKKFNELKSQIKPWNNSGIAIVSKNPIYLYGEQTMFGEVLSLYGIKNLAESLGKAYPEVDEEFIIRQNPELLIGTTDLNWSEFFKEHSVLIEIKANAENKLYNINGDYISRQGPRVFYAIEQLNQLSQ